MIVHDIAIAEHLSLENRCGYWEINGVFFFDKSECLRYATKHNASNVRYHFYDSVYKTLDWSKEPVVNIKQMYRERAMHKVLKSPEFTAWMRETTGYDPEGGTGERYDELWRHGANEVNKLKTK
jgi:hypothetical protein